MNNEKCTCTSKEPKSKSTYLNRLHQRFLVKWDSFSDSTYRFRDRVHTLIHGEPDYLCPCMYEPAVSRGFKSFEDLMKAEKRRIRWERAGYPKEIIIGHSRLSMEPETSGSLRFHEMFENMAYYSPNKDINLEFLRKVDCCRIEEDRMHSRKLEDGTFMRSSETLRRASADANGIGKIKTTLDAFFLWTDGHVHNLNISCKIPDSEWDNPESIAHSSQFIQALGGRKISAILLDIESGGYHHSLNSKFCTFFLDYVDFKMFSLSALFNPEGNLFVIPEKLLKCEFLYFEAPLANSEILCEYKGWGLVLKYLDPLLGFDFFYEVVMNWYYESSYQWRYLSLPCEISEEKWNSLIALGRPVQENTAGDVQASTSKITTETEITRADGVTCRIDREDGNSEPSKVFFYFGSMGKNHIPLPLATTPFLF